MSQLITFPDHISHDKLIIIVFLLIWDTSQLFAMDHAHIFENSETGTVKKILSLSTVGLKTCNHFKSTI